LSVPLVNGKFPFGWYVVGIDDYAAPVSEGSNLVIAYSYFGDASGTAEINQYLTNVYNLDAKVMYQVPPSILEPLDIPAIQTWVNAIKSNAGL